MTARDRSLDIAIVGLACRFPGASHVDAFWQNLNQGRDCLHRVSREDLVRIGVPPELIGSHRFVASSGIISDPYSFAASYFNVSRREAMSMDPQHRLFLEVVVDAFRSAAIDPGSDSGRIGVFAGVGQSNYGEEARRWFVGASGYDPFILELGTAVDYFATRVSYKLNLRGPSFAVQCACSTGLVSVHQACMSLLSSDCDTAIAGAAAVRSPTEYGYMYYPGGIGSRDGVCRPFDDGANGSVPGDGVAAVVLRRFDDAVAGGDPIMAVIRGSAINNDGTKRGFGAVRRQAQRDVVKAAQMAAGVSPAEVKYIEAHGSGTRVGDAVEWWALQDVFQGLGPNSCLLGAVKGNLGHLREASGLAGLIKTVLALREGYIPPMPHFHTLNSEIEKDGSPIGIAHEGAMWPEGSQPRIAGVSAFGLGGTNAHIVVEERPHELIRTLENSPTRRQGLPPYPFERDVFHPRDAGRVAVGD